MASSLPSPATHTLPGWRDPAPLLAAALEHWRASQQALWIFGYASLLWKREFDAMEMREAGVAGWHRAFRMRSRVNRGSVDCPGLVFALMAGGSCVGRVYRVRAGSERDVLQALWEREMPTGVYDPRWLSCRTPQGRVQALAFTLPHRHPSHTGRLSDAALLEIFQRARGRYGSTLEYLAQTATQLERMGIRDAEVQRLMRLAEQLETNPTHADPQAR
ncbi:gamma-glutamylcyclotransferase [Ideonella sp.]|uniref:gamma-glutamylcyclotransferase n=1 Tax=Ideonella sp. TaxID=1929293 RepID=UPI0037BFB7A7